MWSWLTEQSIGHWLGSTHSLTLVSVTEHWKLGYKAYVIFYDIANMYDNNNDWALMRVRISS